MFDGGARCGTDIFKVMALGADTVGIGQPYPWGLCSFGRDGLEVVLDFLTRELTIVTNQARTKRIGKIGQHLVA